MDRTLSSDIDSALSTRNQGQLVSTQRVTTETLRTPGLIPVPNAGGARPLPPGTLQGGGLGFVDVTVPYIGTINWKSLALGAGIGLVVWKLTAARRQRAKAAVVKALS